MTIEISGNSFQTSEFSLPNEVKDNGIFTVVDEGYSILETHSNFSDAELVSIIHNEVSAIVKYLNYGLVKDTFASEVERDKWFASDGEAFKGELKANRVRMNLMFSTIDAVSYIAENAKDRSVSNATSILERAQELSSHIVEVSRRPATLTAQEIHAFNPHIDLEFVEPDADGKYQLFDDTHPLAGYDSLTWDEKVDLVLRVDQLCLEALQMLQVSSIHRKVNRT